MTIDYACLVSSTKNNPLRSVVFRRMNNGEDFCDMIESLTRTEGRIIYIIIIILRRFLSVNYVRGMIDPLLCHTYAFMHCEVAV